MAFTKKYNIIAPNDPEVDVKVRDSLEYYMIFPTSYNEREKYGVVFCISGYGETVNSEYYLNKLCSYISDKYNMISVGVRYHNDARIKEDFSINLHSICSLYGLEQDHFSDVQGDKVIDAVFDVIIQRALPRLALEVCLQTETYHKYSSFGFMPAIDHLFVLSDILKNFYIDRSNIIAFGTSYGGYVASLMAKYAPQTFSLVIDNSGFCVSQLQEVLGSRLGGATGAITKYEDGRRYEIPFSAQTLWSIDETSEYYFSDAHKQIRSLLIEDHRSKSDTMYCCYHSIKDDIAPINLKDKMYEILSKYNPTYYKRVDDKDIDGELFKNIGHGMNASLRKMFDYSMEKYKLNKRKVNEYTDFDLSSLNSFICMNRRYNFSFSHAGLAVNIDKLGMDTFLYTTETQDTVEEPIVEANNVNNIEIIKQIIELLPTLEEGLVFIQQNSSDGDLEEGMRVAEDFLYCINSIEGAIQSMNKDLPQNQIEAKLDRIKESLNVLFESYSMNQREKVIEYIDAQIMPSFIEWEEEVSNILQPFI